MKGLNQKIVVTVVVMAVVAAVAISVMGSGIENLHKQSISMIS